MSAFITLSRSLVITLCLFALYIETVDGAQPPVGWNGCRFVNWKRIKVRVARYVNQIDDECREITLDAVDSSTFADIVNVIANSSTETAFTVYKDVPRKRMVRDDTLKTTEIKAGDMFWMYRSIAPGNPGDIWAHLSHSVSSANVKIIRKASCEAVDIMNIHSGDLSDHQLATPDVRPPDEPYQQTLLPRPQVRHSNGIFISLAELEEDSVVRELCSQALRNVVSPPADNPQRASKESEQSPGHHSRTRQSAPPCLRQESAASTSSKSNAIYQSITALVFSMVICFLVNDG